MGNVNGEIFVGGKFRIFGNCAFIMEISPCRNYTMTQEWRHISLNCKNCNDAKNIGDTIVKFSPNKNNHVHRSFPNDKGI